MATRETVELSEAHSPLPKSKEAFKAVEVQIKAELVKSRHHWNKHEPRMYARAEDVSDADLANFNVEKDLVLVRTAVTAYGIIIFGKIKLPAIQKGGEGFLHVRILDKGDNDIIFHSILTDEGNRDEDGHPTTWNAIQTLNTPLEFFNE